MSEKIDVLIENCMDIGYPCQDIVINILHIDDEYYETLMAILCEFAENLLKNEKGEIGK